MTTPCKRRLRDPRPTYIRAIEVLEHYAKARNQARLELKRAFMAAYSQRYLAHGAIDADAFAVHAMIGWGCGINILDRRRSRP